MSLSEPLTAEKQVVPDESMITVGGDDAAQSGESKTPSSLEHNPFSYGTPVTCYEGSKMFLMVMSGVVLCRVVLLMLTIPWMLLFAFFAQAGVDQSYPPKPIPRWRCIFLFPLRLCCRWILFILGFYWLEVAGNCCPPCGGPSAPVIVCNHVSLLDILILYYIKGPSAVGKAELWDNCVLRVLAQAVQAIPVDRRTAEGRQRCKDLIALQTAGPQYPQLLIFPQGTTTRQTVVSMFKNGAFTPGLPVLPVTITYPHCHFDLCANARPKDWWFLRMFSQVFMRCRVKFMPVHRPTADEVAQPNLYASNVRANIAANLGVPTTEHEYKDMILYKKAKKLRVDLGDFTLHDAQDETGVHVDIDEAKKLIARFRAVDLDGSGSVSLDEFSTVLGMDAGSEHAERMFGFFDRDNDGRVDFKELATGMILCMRHEDAEKEGEEGEEGKEGKESSPPQRRSGEPPATSVDALCRFAFDVFDRDADGKVSWDEFVTMMRQTNRSLDAGDLDTFLRDLVDGAGVDFTGEGVTFEQFAGLVRNDARILKAATTSMDRGFAKNDPRLQGAPDDSAFFPFHRRRSTGGGAAGGGAAGGD